MTLPYFWQPIITEGTQKAHVEYTCTAASKACYRNEHQENPPVDEQVWVGMSNPKGKSLSSHDEGDSDKQHCPKLLNREFRKHGARSVLLTDITYIPRIDSKFSYLSIIVDAYTKQIFSHVTSDSLELDFVSTTVNQLIDKYGISMNAETLIHSDQDCHYSSYKFIELIQDSEFR